MFMYKLNKNCTYPQMLNFFISVNTYYLLRICFILKCYIFGKFREFSNERNRVERRMEFQKCRFRAMFQTAMVSYLDWITQAGF